MSVRTLILTLVVTSVFAFSTFAAAEYQHTITEGDMTFSWTVDGDNLAVKLSAPTKGWVSVGFNPEKQMKGANIIIGYVKDGKVKIKDEYGNAAIQHKADKKLGGSDDVTVVGGTEEGDVTTIEFTIPLDSGDKNDGVIVPDGDTIVMMAYGPERDSFRVVHKIAPMVKTINLSTGAVK